MGPATIKFGTSGWRAIIADEFTFPNVRRAAAAIAGHARSRAKSPRLIVGHDTRFLSEEFARTAAEVLRKERVGVFLCAGPAPTPAIAFEILRRKTDGAINFTASHNPAPYNGLKFSGPDGAPALPEVTRDIESRAAALATNDWTADGWRTEKEFERIDPGAAFRGRLAELVRLDAIRKAGIRIVCDVLHGCGAGYLDRVLAENGITATAIRTNRDVLFGGSGPDVAESNLAPLREAVLEKNAHVGLATDGDADRFGILDDDGAWISPNHILALLYDYLVETRGWKLGAARSVATTHMLDAVAKWHGQECHQTPVGFKYVGELIKQDRIALGGEESAGLSIRGHVPEKDGILACLLVAEMIAVRRAPIREQIRELFHRVGREFWPLRTNLHLPGEVQARTVARLKGDFPSFLGKKVAQQDRTDGLKLVFADGAWVLMRLSGTEPLLRLYTEAGTLAASQQLARDAERWIFEGA